ncbi:hypothetical protein [Nitrospirillum sp. BR 11828]|uniref:hypothetical protein n=1 Tax=Nitrospirillum sp. BR 11828 TaxID=3104325 RepID=UPI002ACA66E6|nr:hypothetical protein [Nitrospirillum sp. BR 11828]MDZ5649470.1 hypothetical protein [Nitrospirillum sp. BR 11828]
MSGTAIEISEVGPRDGLQSISAIMPTEAKKAWIAAEAAAGVREIEVGSFVPAKILPQLADTAEIVAYARTIPGLTVAVLVPNLKGAQAAVAAGAHKITIPLSVSETHSLRNVRRTHAQMLEETAAIAALIREQPEGQRPKLEGGLSTAFGCTLEGIVPEATVLSLAEALMAAGCDEVGLSDTTGYANPAQVRRLIRGVRGVVGDVACTGVHLHNTRGLGLANALAALEEGITTLDSSLGGSAAAPSPPARRATSSPRIWPSCWRPWAMTPASTWSACWPCVRLCARPCRMWSCTASRPTPACLRGMFPVPPTAPDPRPRETGGGQAGPGRPIEEGRRSPGGAAPFPYWPPAGASRGGTFTDHGHAAKVTLLSGLLVIGLILRYVMRDRPEHHLPGRGPTGRREHRMSPIR